MDELENAVVEAPVEPIEVEEIPLSERVISPVGVIVEESK